MSDQRLQEEVDRVNAVIDQLVLTTDATILAACLTCKASALWGALIAIGNETPNSVTKCYSLALTQALEPRDKPQVVLMEGGQCFTKQ